MYWIVLNKRPILDKAFYEILQMIILSSAFWSSKGLIHLKTDVWMTCNFTVVDLQFYVLLNSISVTLR